MMEAGKLTTHRGHLLTQLDQEDREQILELMTKLEVPLKPEQVADAREFLSEMIRDGLVRLEDTGGRTLLRVGEEGKAFLRNACLFFDRRLREKTPQTRIFSKSI
jgi:oxygen-independent coproporphyrinogen-3 oxidase